MVHGQPKGCQFFLYLWLAGSIIAGWPALVTAHGSGAPRLVAVTAGPYRLWVWSLPDPIRVGETHFSVAVEEPATTTSPATVLAVQLDLSAVDQPRAPFTLQANRQDRFLQTYYETDFIMPAVGQWQAIVTITGPAGVGTAAFTFAVLPPQRVNWELVIWSIVMGIAVIWALRGNRSTPSASGVTGSGTKI